MRAAVVIVFLVALDRDAGCQLGRTMGTFLFLRHIRHLHSCRSLRHEAVVDGLAPAGCDMT